MLPFKRDKIDLSKLSPQEQKLFALYGKVPPHKGLKQMKDRKYFDSGDYALSKAGRAPQSTVGTAIPNPENIPHASSSGNGLNGHQIISISPTNSTSPVNKESGLANDTNTKVPEDVQLPQSGVDTDETTTTETTVTKPKTTGTTKMETTTTTESKINETETSDCDNGIVLTTTSL